MINFFMSCFVISIFFIVLGCIFMDRRLNARIDFLEKKIEALIFKEIIFFRNVNKILKEEKYKNGK